jgi:hypothetical protein
MRWALLLAACSSLTACKSAFVDATIRNETGEAVSAVEVDYPTASFGTNSLAANVEYHYKLKVLGSGATKVLWTDASHVDHTQAGPEMHEGQTGRLTVVLRRDKAEWRAELR